MSIIDILTLTYLVIFSIYHIIQGIMSVFFSEKAIKFNEKLYGYRPKETKQLIMNLKPWGSLALAVGVIGLIVALDINKYFIFLLVFAFLLGLRIGYRIIFRKSIYDYWQVSLWQNWRTILIQIIGIIIFSLFVINRL